MLALAVLALLGASPALSRPAGHPQDGPHADLRIAVEPDGVRFAAGLNLAFLDEALAVPRETPDAVADVEVAQLREALETYFRERVVVEIDGVEVTPVFESFTFLNDPDPSLAGIYPRFGMRALMRGAIVARYPALEAPEVVRVTWPTYPRDIVAGEMEGATGPDGLPPFMVLEAQLQALGGLEIVRFSRAKPTIEWFASDAAADRFARVPPVEVESPRLEVSLVLVGLVGCALIASIVAIRSLGWGRGVLAGGAMLLLSSMAAVGMRDIAPVPLPMLGSVSTTLDEDRAVEVFAPLHANLYRAFDYTDEGEVYDALERSVRGDLLGTLYDQIYNSLLDAENGGVLGIVTGVEPLETSLITSMVQADGPPEFRVLHRWRVEGTVYHWGHSHTRLNEYRAAYTVTGTEDGWRITDHQMRSQRRVDDSGRVIDDLPPPLPTEL